MLHHGLSYLNTLYTVVHLVRHRNAFWQFPEIAIIGRPAGQHRRCWCFVIYTACDLLIALYSHIIMSEMCGDLMITVAPPFYYIAYTFCNNSRIYSAVYTLLSSVCCALLLALSLSRNLPLRCQRTGRLRL